MEINPSNQTLTQLRDHWQKICVLVMRKLGAKEVDITERDVAEVMAEGMPFLVTHGRKDGFKLVLVKDQAAAVEYIAKNVGRG